MAARGGPRLGRRADRAGVKVTDLAREFGTPLFVLDEEDFRARAAEFKRAFDNAFDRLCGGVDVYYAGKAFLCTEVARWVTEEGLRLDTCSGGELLVAQHAGVPAQNLSLHGNNKSVGRSPGPSNWAWGASWWIRSTS